MGFQNIVFHQTSVEGSQTVTHPDGLLQNRQHLLELGQRHLGHRLTLQLLLGNLLRPGARGGTGRDGEGRGGQGVAAGSSQFVMARTSS